jgi:hypothetical protein
MIANSDSFPSISELRAALADMEAGNIPKGSSLQASDLPEMIRKTRKQIEILSAGETELRG